MASMDLDTYKKDLENKSEVPSFAPAVKTQYSRNITVEDWNAVIYSVQGLLSDVSATSEFLLDNTAYQLQYSSTNVRGYGNGVVTAKDLQSLADGQLIFMPPTSMEGDKRQELWYVTKTDGVNNAEKAPVAVEGNRPYFVYTKANYSPSKEVQSVGTGLVSYFYDENNKERVVYGTDSVADGYGFFVNVLDASGNYSGAISLGAKVYKFNNAQGVKFLEMDDNATYLRSYNGTCELKMESGKTTLISSEVDFGGWLSHSGSQTHFLSGLVQFDNGLTQFKGSAYFYNDAQIFIAPTGVYHLTNKSYVDSTAEAQATEKTNALQVTLQAEIDAINASQNFVATYGKKADLPTAPSGILENDCVLILQDEEHDNASTVYKWTGSAWEFVGKLGDCYTKAEIDAEHNEIKSEISEVNTKYASMFTATSSKTAESE